MVIYIPGFYVMYSHMLSQRKKQLSSQVKVKSQVDGKVKTKTK